MIYDQDFIYADSNDGKPLKMKMECPNCGRVITASVRWPMPEVRCRGLVPCTAPREKGQPRKVMCDTVMVEIIKGEKE